MPTICILRWDTERRTKLKLTILMASLYTI
jgi:hypothetical protein